MCATLCGIDDLEEIVAYGKNKQAFLKGHFGIDKIPSESTLTRVLNMVNGEQVGLCIVNIMKELFGTNGEIVAIDGKTICSTEKMACYKKSLHILTAYITENGVSIGQLAVDEKTNEIPCMRELLDLIDIKGKIVTADAMHAQKDTVAKIIEKEGDYCIGIKGNQKNFYDDIKLYIDDLIISQNADDKKLYETAQTSEKSRDRYEKRTCYLFRNIDWLYGKEEWAGLKSILAVNRKTTRNDVKTEEVNYYISSLDVSPEKFLEIVREHWKIESLHWQLDMIFHEDDCRILSTNGQKSLNVFRKLALAMQKNYKTAIKHKKSMKNTMFNCLLNDDLLIKLICL
jgi:predicted transposase YbfD/YdcC